MLSMQGFEAWTRVNQPSEREEAAVCSRKAGQASGFGRMFFFSFEHQREFYGGEKKQAILYSNQDSLLAQEQVSQVE